MASIFQLPAAQNTGLSRLGDVVLGSAAEYAQNRRADEREARQRQQRLADVESDRGYARTEGDRQYGRARTDRLADVGDARDYTKTEQKRLAEAAIRHELIQQRYLGADFVDAPLNSDAVRAAFAAAAKAGIVKNNPLVKEAMVSGIVTDAMLDDPESLAAGLSAFSYSLQQQTKKRERFEEEAQTRLDEIATSRNATRGEQSKLGKILGAPDTAIDPNTVTALATEIAMANIPKAGWFSSQQTQPSQAEIDALVPSVKLELEKAARLSDEARRKDAIVQRSLLADESQGLSAEANTLMNISRRVGRANLQEPPARATTTATQAPTAASGRRTPEEFIEEVRARFAASKPPPSAPTTQGNFGFGGVGMGSAPVSPAPAAASPPTTRAPSYPMTRAPTPTPTGLLNPMQIPPEVEFEQLQRSLLSLSDLTSVDAQTIRNRMDQLRQRLPSPSLSTPAEYSPRPMGSRLFDPTM